MVMLILDLRWKRLFKCMVVYLVDCSSGYCPDVSSFGQRSTWTFERISFCYTLDIFSCIFCLIVGPLCWLFLVLLNFSPLSLSLSLSLSHTHTHTRVRAHVCWNWLDGSLCRVGFLRFDSPCLPFSKIFYPKSTPFFNLVSIIFSPFTDKYVLGNAF